ncbi:hypothetical protein SF06_23370 [Pseudomonas flexibilis]|nr:hypothetical protein SF06_23370 [Pseudomonas flexibilis]
MSNRTAEGGEPQAQKHLEHGPPGIGPGRFARLHRQAPL